MNQPRHLIDGDWCVLVPVAELDEWASTLTNIEDWLLHAPAVADDDDGELTGMRRPHDVARLLGHWVARMRSLTGDRP